MSNLFQIHSLSSEGTQISAQLVLQRDHEIFRGHFPSQALVPGVCMVEIMREIISEHFHKPYYLQSASIIKFLGMILPDEVGPLRMDINLLPQEAGCEARAILVAGERICFKFQGLLHV